MRWLVIVLVAAAALRFGYQEGMLAFGGSFHNGSDSGKYLAVANGIYESGQFARMTAEGLQDEVNRMPVYPYFLAGLFWLFGQGNLHAVVLVQIALDILMIGGLALAAAAIDRRLALPTAVVAAIIPNFLVHVSYILTETVFLVFFVWGLCACLWALRGRHAPWLLTAAGVCFGMALLTRPVMAYFAVVLSLTLLVTLPRLAAPRLWRRLVLSALPAIVIFAFAAPRIIDNYVTYGVPILTNQSGVHLLKWVYPCLRTPWSCASIKQAWEENRPIVEQRVAALPEQDRNNPAKIDLIRRDVAIERIRELGFRQVAWGMAVGAFRNLVQTGFYAALRQFNKPPTFFSAMPGATVGEKLKSFVTHNWSNGFMLIWAVSQTALLLSRVVQLIGLGAGLFNRAQWPFTLFLAMTVAYFLVLTGPVGDPKYRIPMEPALLIFFSIGLYTTIDWVRRRRSSIPLPRTELQ